MTLTVNFILKIAIFYIGATRDISVVQTHFFTQAVKHQYDVAIYEKSMALQ